MLKYKPRIAMQIKLNIPAIFPKTRNAYAVSIEGILPKAMFSEEMATKAGMKIVENNFLEERKLRKIENLQYNINLLKETIPTIKNPLAKKKREIELKEYIWSLLKLKGEKKD